MPEPLPVRIVAVEDVRLDAAAGLEERLHDFYVRLLEFERAAGDELAYRAENFTVRFVVHETPPPRESLRPLGVIVLSLADAERKLLEREIEYTRQRGVTPGSESLLVLDPAGNWVEIQEDRRIL